MGGYSYTCPVCGRQFRQNGCGWSDHIKAKHGRFVWNRVQALDTMGHASGDDCAYLRKVAIRGIDDPVVVHWID